MNTVLMQGYRIELNYNDAWMHFDPDTYPNLSEQEIRAKRKSLMGHYYWIASITSHGGQKHLALQSHTIGPSDDPLKAMRKFMEAVGFALAGCAEADAKELVPEPAHA